MGHAGELSPGALPCAGALATAVGVQNRARGGVGGVQERSGEPEPSRLPLAPQHPGPAPLRRAGGGKSCLGEQSRREQPSCFASAGTRRGAAPRPLCEGSSTKHARGIGGSPGAPSGQGRCAEGRAAPAPTGTGHTCLLQERESARRQRRAGSAGAKADCGCTSPHPELRGPFALAAPDLAASAGQPWFCRC